MHNKSEQLRASLVTFGQIQQSFQKLRANLQSITNVLNDVTAEGNAFTSAIKATNTMAGMDAAGFKELKSDVADLAKNIPMALAKGCCHKQKNEP